MSTQPDGGPQRDGGLRRDGGTEPDAGPELGARPQAHGAPTVHELPDYVDAVLEVADAIPPGQVLTYGDIAGIVGSSGPRQVGKVMAHYGSLTCWWRVVRADGSPPRCHEQRAGEHYREEGTPMKGARIDMGRARWQP